MSREQDGKENRDDAPHDDYALIDSGNGVKIERLGGRVISRPSSWCIWKLGGASIPGGAAEPTDIYDPKNEGWTSAKGAGGRGAGDAPTTWPVGFPALNVVMEARLQRNGQIGIFPEHASYLPRIAAELQRKPGAKVLNLFAFTGLASMVALKNGATVTHVDILKPVLDWAARNADLNEVNRGELRLIPEEALVFIGREARRGNKYDLIILDPPSFSRIGKGKDWELDLVLRELLAGCLAILNPGGSIYFTCHHGELAGVIVENLFRELLQDQASITLTSSPLQLRERFRERSIPAGFLTVLNT